MTEPNMPILSLCLLWPLMGAVAVFAVKDWRVARGLALGVSLLELLLTLLATSLFDSQNGAFQLQEEAMWIPSLNIHYRLGVDGISLWFLPMTALLTSMGILAGWNSLQRLTRFHLALLLVLESVTIGVLTALDLALFFLFWELTLPPLFFLIGLWGVGAKRRAAALQYVLSMLFGGVPLLFGIILVASPHGQASTAAPPLNFSLPDLLNGSLPMELQTPVFALLVLGFAVKVPLAPLHTWLPATAMEAPPQITALLLGLKLGVYGLLRFALPLAPLAAQQHRWLLAILGALTLMHGALLALQQTNLRRLLAYAGVSHVGLVVIGLAGGNLQSVQGALLQTLNFTIVASSLMLIAGMLQQRLGSNELLQLGGLAKPLPRLTTLFFLFALSSIGVPGLNGFPAELLLMLGTLQAFPQLAAVILLAGVLAAAYVLNAARKAFFGPLSQTSSAQLQDLRSRELLLLAIPLVLVLALGCFPQRLIDSQTSAINLWLQRQQMPVLQLTDARHEVARAAR